MWIHNVNRNDSRSCSAPSAMTSGRRNYPGSCSRSLSPQTTKGVQWFYGQTCIRYQMTQGINLTISPPILVLARTTPAPQTGPTRFIALPTFLGLLIGHRCHTSVEQFVDFYRYSQFLSDLFEKNFRRPCCSLLSLPGEITPCRYPIVVILAAT